MTFDIPPLRKRTKEGILYSRPTEIEEAILESLDLPFDDFINRAKIQIRCHAKYVPSEVLVHRIRAARNDASDEQFNALYSVLIERISRSCPRAVISVDGGIGELGYLKDEREYVMDRFVTLIVKDRNEYEEKLDIFEARFDRALSMLRKDAFRKVRRYEEPLTPLEYDECGDVPDEVEEFFALLNPPLMTLEEQITYRSQIRGAIDILPEMERRVMTMLEADIPIESKNPDEQTISRLLGCTPKTVRNRRDRAIQRIRIALGEEGSDAK